MPLEKKRTSRHQPIPGNVSGGGTSSGGYCNQKSVGFPERQRPSKCRSCCRKFTAFMFSHVGLCALVIGYSIMGAFAFRALESPYEVEKASQVIAMREKTVHRLWDITVEFNVLYKDNWTSTVGKEIQEFQNKLITAVKEGYDGKDHGSSQWSFSGAFLYSLTVITTIGYGNIAPKTSWGKIVTIIYAIAGIPLMLLYLTNIGDLLAKAFKYVYGHLCYCKSYNSGRRGRRPHHHLHHHHVAPPHEQYRIHHIVVHDAISNAHNSIDYVNKFAAAREEELKLESLGATANVGIAPGILHQEEELDYGKTRVTVPITLCLALITLYICGGAALFSLWEEWNYLDGYYFCFVTLSTIGFGDLVPGDTVVSDTGSQEKLVICSLYLLTGMALIAMCFNLVQEQVVFKIRNLGKRMGIVNDYEDPND